MSEAPTHVAAADCERCRHGLIAQPVNTVSSLAFVGAGWLALRGTGRARSVDVSQAAVGWAAVAAGLGSAAYHGPGTAVGRYVHDASLLALLGAVAVADVGIATGRQPPVAVMASLAPVALVAARPRWSMASQLVFGLAAVAAEGVRFSVRPARGAARRRRLLETTVAGAGAAAHALGRTGGPLCDPDSRVQPHALWHGAIAAAVWLRAKDAGTA